jgi:hypothetical protein
MMSRDVIRCAAPTASQLAQYSDGASLPPIDRVEFIPGNRRPRVIAKTIPEVVEVLHEAGIRRFERVVVRFQGERWNYEAQIEKCFEKTMLVIEGTGIVASVTEEAISV